MSPIPWAAILTHGPTIVSAARALLATQSRKVVDERNQPIDARLEHLEKTSVETARLLQEMAEQLQALTTAQQELQNRLRVALIVSVIAIALGATAVAIALASTP